MPFIRVTTNQKLQKEAKIEIKKQAGSLITEFPNKTEKALMVQVQDDVDMYFRGEEVPCIKTEIELYKESTMEAKQAFTAKFILALSEVTGVPVDNIYLTITEYATWGSKGTLK